jgi:phosphoglycerate dehydrogenase-like enzyme
MLAQNVPFTPMVDSWATRSEKLVAVDPERARERIAAIGATVLSNQAPPYAIPGGMYDALRSSDGEMFGVTNEAAAGVAERFLAEEGVDLEPAAAVALASLPAVAATLGANAGRVLVHLTGGGWTTFYEPSAGPPVEPTLTLTVADAEDPRALDRVEAAFERASRRPMSAPIAPLAASSTIVIAESLAGGSLEPFEHLDARVRYEPALANDRAALLRAVRNATALVVRNTVRVDRELLAAAPALRAIGRLGTGLDNIDVEAARERGIPIVDSGRANANAVAEYVLAAMLSSERRIDACDDAVRSGAWPRFHMSFGELLGKTLGIVGLGRCGSRLALVARALGMDVLGTRRTPDLPPALADTGVERVELDELLGRAQYVVLLMPPLASGAAAIGAAELRRMRTDAVLINPGRGSLVDEAALLAALDAGRLRGAVLDTRAHEPPEANDPLVAHPLVTSTPHVAGLTAEAQLRVGAIVARGIGRAIGAPAPARARV